ncbi:MAG: hypothetical protein ACI8P0_004021, partial [Planctomycetaceae bacterium]
MLVRFVGQAPLHATVYRGRDPKTWVLLKHENIETPFQLMVEFGP